MKKKTRQKKPSIAKPPIDKKDSGKPVPQKNAVRERPPIKMPPDENAPASVQRKVEAMLECPLPPKFRQSLSEHIADGNLASHFESTLEFCLFDKELKSHVEAWLKKYGIQSNADLFWTLNVQH